ncbi:MAG: twin-arginine translocation pathway signal, partial [Planctomycetota bacterium]
PLRMERVIFAAPQFLARYLIRPYRDDPPAHCRDFEYVPWLVANLALCEHPGGLGFPLCWDNVFYESPSLGYVVATHQMGAERGPTVLTYYHAFCDRNTREARARLLAGDWRHWAQAVLADLSRAHPELPALVERLDVMRWGHAMVRPRPGFLWSASRLRAAEPCRGIHFAHSDLSGLALFEEAFYHGLRAAEEVLAGLNLPPAERFV